jgi:hypothetical protein
LDWYARCRRKAASFYVPSTGPTLDAYTQGLVDQLRTATLTGGDTATPARALADLSTNVSGDGSRVVRRPPDFE